MKTKEGYTVPERRAEALNERGLRQEAGGADDSSRSKETCPMDTLK